MGHEEESVGGRFCHIHSYNSCIQLFDRAQPEGPSPGHRPARDLPGRAGPGEQARKTVTAPENDHEWIMKMTAPSRSKLRGKKKEAGSSGSESALCPFAPVESFLVAKLSIGERRSRVADPTTDLPGHDSSITLASSRIQNRGTRD